MGLVPDFGPPMDVHRAAQLLIHARAADLRAGPNCQPPACPCTHCAVDPCGQLHLANGVPRMAERAARGFRAVHWGALATTTSL
jgi:hypothetical protein